jgi:osmoprotectant transport system permease protein
MQWLAVTILVATAATAASAAEPDASGAGPIVVGSKNFEENRLLAEMFAILIETQAGVVVERKLNLAGTQICFRALRDGAIDLYPEYTGTALVSILGEPAGASETDALQRVRRVFRERWDLWWTGPLGFENSYEIAVPRRLANRLRLRTISDLVPVADRLRAGLGYEFLEREDGYPGLQRVYGLEFADTRAFQQALKYQAAEAGEIDVLDVYTTDGRLAKHDFVLLEDDLEFFPPYAAAPLVRGAVLRERPGVAAALSTLSGVIDEERMRAWNLRLQERGVTADGVARSALVELGLLHEDRAGAAEDASEREGTIAYMVRNRASLGRLALEHLALASTALVLGVLMAVPTGLWLERRRSSAESVIRVIAITQTVPSLALLAFFIPLLGIGVVPAVVALWVYSLFPILRNTYTGVRDADPEAVEAATALGMTPAQVLRHVRLPLAAPIILAGVRTAAVLLVGTATLAAFIGAGGLGEPIVAGLQLADTRRILSGAIPAAVLALIVDGLLALVERWTRPRGLTRAA